MHKNKIGLLVGLALVLSPLSFAEQTGAKNFASYVSGLKKEALEQGFTASLVEEAFSGIIYHERAVQADKNQPEKKLLLDEYLTRALPQWKITKAKNLYNENKALLEKIGKEFGVQPRFIVALWGIESNFGQFTGNFNVIEALTTLAFDGRREAFFRKEVFSALQILQQGHIAPKQLKGSWAGAMGQCQFMPSSFLTFAADGDGDGKKDIWQNRADVFASAANYLKKSGWDDSYTWGRQVTLPTKGIDPQLIGISNDRGKSLAQWQNLGVRNAENKALPNVDIKAWLISPDDNKGRSYLVYGNYQALMRWNRSHYFGLAVSKLADAIK
ncbi:MAG: lytic murein transglycosylase [Vibrionaceae bacterium]